jgi:hypothetical protein
MPPKAASAPALTQEEFVTVMEYVSRASRSQKSIIFSSIKIDLELQADLPAPPPARQFVKKNKEVKPLSLTQAENWRTKSGQVLSATLQQKGVNYREDGQYLDKELRIANAAVVAATNFQMEVREAKKNNEPLPDITAWRVANYDPVVEEIRKDPVGENPTDEITLVDWTVPGSRCKKRKRSEIETISMDTEK